MEFLTIVADGPLRAPAGIPSLNTWSLDPKVVILLALVGGLYAVGWGRMRERVRRSLLPSWRAWCFGSGLTILWLALFSPLGTLADYFLFAHMIEHMLLLMIVPPLLWLGAPLLVVLWAFPLSVRRAIGKRVSKGSIPRATLDILTHPAIAASVFLAVVAVWHVPRLYDLAQAGTILHQVEHLFFLSAGLLYWWPVVHPAAGRRRLGYGQTFLYLAPWYVEQVILGALLTFAPVPVYAYYAYRFPVWNLSALMDQELAGVIMWVAGGVIVTLQAAAVFIAWSNAEERTEAQGLAFTAPQSTS